MPWLLSAPALLLFIVIVLVPIAMTALLSFHEFSTSTGIRPVFSLVNWIEVFTDGYFHEMFLRTLRISLVGHVHLRGARRCPRPTSSAACARRGRASSCS